MMMTTTKMRGKTTQNGMKTYPGILEFYILVQQKIYAKEVRIMRTEDEKERPRTPLNSIIKLVRSYFS